MASREVEQLLLLEHREHFLRLCQTTGGDQLVGKRDVYGTFVAQERSL
jgi:hypothetical protein